MSDIRIFPAFAFIRKSPDAQPVADFKLSALYEKRGIELVGEKNLNLKGVTKLIADRVANNIRRELDRLGRRKRQRTSGQSS